MYIICITLVCSSIVPLTDYSNLFFNQLSDPKEIKATMQEIDSRNSKLEATLARIAAPNMKAIDK